MRHAADGKRLDQRLTVCVVPYAARVAPARFLIRGTVRKPVHVGPLANDVFTVERLYDRIAIAATLVGRRANNAVSQGRCLVPWILA
jgi:hypothetical protein